MKDSGFEVRAAYFTALNGNLTALNSSNVPVYDDVPNNAPYPYVKLSDQTQTQEEMARDCTSLDTTILIDIVTGFIQGGGKKESDNLANQILQIVHPSISVSGFQSFDTVLEASNTLEEKTDSHKIYRRLLRFRNVIHELSS